MKSFLALIAITLLSGCASIVSSDKTAVVVTSDPSGATFKVANEEGKIVHTGTTPVTLNMQSHGGAFDPEAYTLTFSKPGYDDKSYLLEAESNEWIWGNLVFGGLIGIVVDTSTGAAWELPEQADVDLVYSGDAAAVAQNPYQRSSGSSAYYVPRYTPPSTKMSDQEKAQKLADLQAQNLGYQEYMAKYRELEAQ
jgi:hypothetical protein